MNDNNNNNHFIFDLSYFEILFIIKDKRMNNK
jgi:hypothetical protein